MLYVDLAFSYKTLCTNKAENHECGTFPHEIELKEKPCMTANVPKSNSARPHH